MPDCHEPIEGRVTVSTLPVNLARWPESWPAHHVALFPRIGDGSTGNVQGKSKVTYSVLLTTCVQRM